MTTPWRWIPTLYVAEGLPYIAVNTLTVLMFFQLGMPKLELALYTSWLYLPWVIKPFWSPFIDLFSTKRRWTIAMQYLMALCMAAIGFLIPGPAWFGGSLAVFWLLAFFSATHDIAADGYYMLELDTRQQAAFVGVRSTFYRIASVLGQGGLVVLAGWLHRCSGSVADGWGYTFYILAGFFLLLALYHGWGMPSPADDRAAVKAASVRTIARGFGESFVSFFQKTCVWAAIGFMLLYRLPEALCLKLVAPFLVDLPENGGLGLSTEQVGVANGTVGVICLLAGGIVGGWAISRGGLRRWLWPMGAALALPCVVYCWLSMTQPADFRAICAVIGVEQFGYGFGFTAFMMYLMVFSKGEMQTSHYAFCTAFMALGMMLPGMAAGWLHDLLEPIHIFGSAGPQGYINFFWAVTACSLFTFIGVYLALGTLKDRSAN